MTTNCEFVKIRQFVAMDLKKPKCLSSGLWRKTKIKCQPTYWNTRSNFETLTAWLCFATAASGRSLRFVAVGELRITWRGRNWHKQTTFSQIVHLFSIFYGYQVSYPCSQQPLSWPRWIQQASSPPLITHDSPQHRPTTAQAVQSSIQQSARTLWTVKSAASKSAWTTRCICTILFAKGSAGNLYRRTKVWEVREMKQTCCTVQTAVLLRFIVVQQAVRTLRWLTSHTSQQVRYSTYWLQSTRSTCRSRHTRVRTQRGGELFGVQQILIYTIWCLWS